MSLAEIVSKMDDFVWGPVMLILLVGLVGYLTFIPVPSDNKDLIITVMGVLLGGGAAAMPNLFGDKDTETEKFTYNLPEDKGNVSFSNMTEKQAEDLYAWAPVGPGSSRGLNRLLGRPLNKSWEQSEFNEQLRIIWTEIAEQLDMEDLTLHDVQNCMCELDKMWRVLAGEGAPRSIYSPETSY